MKHSVTISNRQRSLVIQTPEGIVFPLLIASPIRRYFALFIDLLFIMALSTTLGQAVRIFGIISRDFASAATIIIYFLISQGYRILLEWKWQGRTIGKRFMRLQVMDEQGLRLRFSQVVIRNLLRFFDQLPMFYLLGGTTMLINAWGQRLGDIAANTIVIYHPKIPDPDLDHILKTPFNSFRSFPHLVAKLRQRLSLREANLAFQALLRRDELDADARLDLFKKLRIQITQQVTFPEQATEGISDEQYIRNVVDILFRVRAFGDSDR
jgi:uncharacterized RDD family membrane protein YckC